MGAKIIISDISQSQRSVKGLWAFLCMWLMMLALAAAVSAPAVHAETAKHFGEANNLAESSRFMEGRKKAAATSQPAYMTEDQPLQLKDYQDPKLAEPAPWWQQVLGFLFKVLLVLGLIAASLLAVKKLSGGRMALSLPNTKGRNIVVLETTHLNPQQAIHLISLGGERLLVVGASQQGLSTLSEISDPQQVRVLLQAQKPQAATSTFNQAFDLEKVVQESNSELFAESIRELGEDPRYRRGWSE